MSISIFAKPAFRHRRDKHLGRVSSIIRADQIAQAIGAKLNPTEGYEDDVCIYVKPHIKPGHNFNFEGKRAYLDIIDGHVLGNIVSKHKKVGVIVCSMSDYKVMSQSIKNKVVFIPQHHCNFERKIKKMTSITTVGCIGTKEAFPFLPKDLKKRLNEKNLELVEFSDFHTREDIVDFYLNIDVQIVWRPYKKWLSNPLKLVNAASFGIPTIALDEPAFEEMEGCYLPVNTLEEFMKELEMLTSSPIMQEEYRERCLHKAEEYHIEKVSQMYLQL